LEEGGVVRSVIDLCAALASRGQRVTLLTNDAADAPKEWTGKDNTPAVVTIPPMGMLTRRVDSAVKQALGRASVLHLHTPWEPGNVALARQARRLGLPYIVSVHGMLDDWSMGQSRAKKQIFLALLGTRLLEDAAFVHCTAQAELTQAKEHFPQGRGVVAPLVFDVKPYADLPGVELAASRWPALGNDRPTLLFLSRVHYKKGVERLIDAAAALKKRGCDVDVLIAGPGDKEYLEALNQRVRECDVADRVEFLGSVDGAEKVSLYQAADLFVLPTSQENFGFVFFEALGAGTPVVTTKGVDTWPELESSGGARIVGPDANDFADAIEALLNEPAKLEAMGGQGRAWTLERFGGTRVVDEYITLYQEAADHRRTPERITLTSLRRASRKGGANSSADPFWVSRYFYRRFTIYFTWLCAKMRLSANTVTALSAVAVFAGAVAYGLPSRWAWLAGALLVQMYFILDHVDGEMARYERTVLGRRSGMAGVFYDTACHAGETAVIAVIAMRLFADLNQPWWVMLTLVVALFPGGIDPWQRYAEAVLAHGERTAADGKVVLESRFFEKSSLSLSAGGETKHWRKMLGLVSQTVGFPGYFVTLLFCTILDLAPALSIYIAEQHIPYLYLWLLSRACLKAAAGVKSTLVYGRRLRHLG